MVLRAGSIYAIMSQSDSIHFYIHEGQQKLMSLDKNGLGVGVSTMSANLHVRGNVLFESTSVRIEGASHTNFQIASSNTRIGNVSYVLVNSNTSSHLSLRLPNINNSIGRILKIKSTNSSANLVMYGDTNIDGYSAIKLNSENSLLYPSIELINSGNAWLVMGMSGQLNEFSGDKISTLSTSLSANDGIEEYRTYVGSFDLDLGDDINIAVPAYDQIVGLRYQLNLPQKDLITSATIDFVSQNTNSTNLSLLIEGHDSGDSEDLVYYSLWDPMRERTSANVQWDPVTWTTNNTYSTPDLSNIVQEVVNRDDWSSGSNITFIFSKLSSSSNVSRAAKDSGNFPVLKVTSVSQPSGLNVNISSGEDTVDVQKDIYGSSSTRKITGHIELGVDNTPRELMVGLKFDNLPFEYDDIVIDARIQFTATAPSSGNKLKLRVYVENDTNAGFDTENISDKFRTNRSSLYVEWDVPDWLSAEDAGVAQQTPNLRDLVNSRLQNSNWNINDSICFVIVWIEGDKIISAYAYNTSSSRAPKLILKYE